MCREFVNSHFRSSLEFFHFMDISDTSISKCFFSLSQIFVKSVLSSRFFIPITYVIHFQTIGMSLFLKFTNASVKSTIFRKINTDENRKLTPNNFVRKKIVTDFLMQKTIDPHQITVITDVRFMVLELSRSRSVVSNAHIQAFAQKLAHVLDSLVRTAKKKELWARTPVLTPVPVQAFHSRACLNSHRPGIQGTAQKSRCVNTF